MEPPGTRFGGAVRGGRGPDGAPGERPRVLLVTGPTASGKTAFSLELAERLGGEIVSADSMQVYRHLDVGTAKPTGEERRRVPHHLIDVADPDEVYNVGRYRSEADTAIRDVLGRGKVCVVVGGTALYLKALLHGLAPGPGRSAEIRSDLEARWEAGDREALWTELSRADPDLAGRLHPSDRTRIIRGLEVWLSCGSPLSAIQARHGFSESPYDALRFGLRWDRDALYARIDRRVEEMLAAGWLQEVRRVLALGYSSTLPALQAVGYRELCLYLTAGGSLAAVLEEIQKRTRRYAKRQMTWFRRMDLTWVAPGDLPDVVERAKNFLQSGGAPL